MQINPKKCYLPLSGIKQQNQSASMRNYLIKNSQNENLLGAFIVR